MERPRVIVVGGGFAGVQCARGLERELAPREAEIALVTPNDFQLYLPLLPQVASGVLTPQAVAPSLRRLLRRTRIVPGGVIGVDTEAKVCVVRLITGDLVNLRYDQLVLAPGSVTRTFGTPGLDRHAHGMKRLAEAAAIRDHVIAQLDLASVTEDEAERAARLRFVVAGGGYAGTETVACLQRLTNAAAPRYRGLDPRLIEWHLVEHSPRLMPELGERLGSKALQIVTGRGTEVSLGVSVDGVTKNAVALTDGRSLPSRTLIWTAGVAASPLIDTLDAETAHGRLVVSADLRVPGRDGVFALGDAAAVPDLAQDAHRAHDGHRAHDAHDAHDGHDAHDAHDGAICPPTAQHAMRQGRQAARNVAAVLRGKPTRPYEHRDLGFVVDLGGMDAVAHPLGVELTGLPAQLVTRAYHLAALRTGNARGRTIANWLCNATTGNDFVRTGFASRGVDTLSGFEGTDVYLSRDRVRELTTV